MIDITAAQLSQLAYVGGRYPDPLLIRAFDGTSWSAKDNAAWTTFLVGPNERNISPVVTTANISGSRGQTLSLSSLFTVYDADDDAVTQYQLRDGTGDPNSGYFTINGVAQPAGTAINVSAAQLAQVAFVVGKIPDVLQIRV